MLLTRRRFFILLFVPAAIAAFIFFAPGRGKDKSVKASTDLKAMADEEIPSGSSIIAPQVRFAITWADIVKQEEEAAGRLRIPKFGVDVVVEPLVVDGDEEIEVPEDVAKAGWASSGPYPGNRGSAVLTGSVRDRLGWAGAFWDIDQVKHGDTLTFLNRDGATLTFRVTSVEVYDASSLPGDDIFGSPDGAHLNLVSGDGVWIDGKFFSDKRAVVFSSLEADSAFEL